MSAFLFRAVGPCIVALFMGVPASSATIDPPLLGFAASGATAETLTTGQTGGGQPISRNGPSLALTPLIRTEGDFTELGKVTWFGGNFAPRGFQLAQGQRLPIGSNTALFAKLGTTYGGDGRTNFALPDLRGRAAVGASATLRAGTRMGTNSLTLTESHLPTHTHTLAPGLLVGGTTEPTGGGVSFTNRQPSLAMPYRTDAGGGAITLDAAVFDDGTATPVPQLADRLPIGAGTGPGLTTLRDGELTGTDRTTLTEETMPAHTHALPEGGNTGSTGGSQPIQSREPSMALRFIVAVQGVYPSRSLTADTLAASSLDAEPMLGEIAMFAGNFAPRGWTFAEGQLLATTSNEALFSLFGTIYGGDGRTTFALPDLRGRTPVGFGNGPGLQSVFLGQRFGSETISLGVSELPIHRHDFIAPVPLPLPGLALFGGLGALGLMRWKRRSA